MNHFIRVIRCGIGLHRSRSWVTYVPMVKLHVFDSLNKSWPRTESICDQKPDF